MVANGGKDENVFDIQQGVGIGLFISQGLKQVSNVIFYHADIWGERDRKYSSERTKINQTDGRLVGAKGAILFIYVPFDFSESGYGLD